MNHESDILQLARAFLSFSPMSSGKLQKLCYYAKAWYLAIYDENLVVADFKAGVHGAEQQDIKEKYIGYGYDDIPQETNTSGIPELFLDFAKDVYSVYGGYSEYQLEYINHREPPWMNARNGLEPWEHSENMISEEDMKKCYRERMK